MQPERHLILVHSPGWQDIEDFEDIASRVARMAPDIKPFVISNDNPGAIARKRSAERPSLIFSPIRLGAYRPRRGRIFEGQTMSKLDEMDRLSAAGLPVPDYEVLTPATRLDPMKYGDYVIVKPSYALSSFGQGIALIRSDQVTYKPAESYPDWHPGQKGPMLVQRLIHCGYAMTTRVLTLFGIPLLTYCRHSTRKLVLDQAHEPFEQADFMPMRPSMRVYAPRDEDVLELAARAYDALPEAALQACDILRDWQGNLYILEVNPGGGNWMFSSDSAPHYREALGIADLTEPFDAFENAARILIHKTRELAE